MTCELYHYRQEGHPALFNISIVDIATLLKNIDIDKVILDNIDIDKVILENSDIDINKDNPANIDIDIDKDILNNIDIDINIDKDILENINIIKDIIKNIDIDKDNGDIENIFGNKIIFPADL